MKTKQNQKGFTLIELVVYVAGLVILSGVMVLIIIQFYMLYKEIIAVPRADRTGLTLVDRITKEIRSGDQIDTLNSQFNTTDGIIEFDSEENGSTVARRFYVENGIVKFSENGGTAVSLSPKDLYVSNFQFKLVSTSVSQAVRFDLELQFMTRNGTETKPYTGFSILRESYE
jgi:Tfp pilus assembly protein PilV